MRMAGDDPVTVGRVREMLDRQVRQLATIVEDLIDVSRIVERKIGLSIERVPIERVVTTAVESSRPVIESCGHQLTVELPKEPLHVDADPVRLPQIIVNLLNNAAKFTAAGGRIWLTVEAARKGKEKRPSEVVIRVRDTGVGIPDELKGRIFEVFEQGPSPPGGGAGLGVGLTLVRSLVHMHGGAVEVASEGLGRGSEFIVRLPAADPRSPPPSAVKGRDGETRDGVAVKVLVVDDNRDQAQSLTKLLTLLGHEVRLAFDGEQALREAAAFLPDVALVDIGLPGMSGHDVARAIRKDGRLRNTVLVAQTGWGQEHDRQRSREAGFDHHLVKPAELSELREILATVPRKTGS
jgi:CheY-like chemotaxis protein